MVHNRRILLFITLLCSVGHQTIFSEGQVASTYCVSPNPAIYQNKTCHTFSYYLTAVTKYFTWSTTLLFLPGTHNFIFTAGKMVVIKDVGAVNFVGVKLHSNDNVSINCNRNIYAGITFTNITTVNIVNLTISNCGAQVSEFEGCTTRYDFVCIAALVASNVGSFLVQDTVVENSTKIGIFGYIVAHLSIIKSKFVGNSLSEKCRGVTTSHCNLVISFTRFFTSGHGFEVENSTVSVVNSWVVGNYDGINVKNSNASFRGLIMLGPEYDDLDTFASGIRCTNSTLAVYGSSFSGYAACITASTCITNVSLCNFENNSDVLVTYVGSQTRVTDSIFVQNSGFSQFHQDSSAILKNTTYYNNRRSCIFAYNSTIEFNGQSLFQNCLSVGFGGAIYLISSIMLLTAPANVSFVNNTAYIGGGAIYAQSPFIKSFEQCFLQIIDEHGTLNNPGVRLYFEGNKAWKVGSVLYGNIKSCHLDYYKVDDHPLTIFAAISTIDNNISAIASDAFTMCVCKNNTASPDCSLNQSYSGYPGQTISIVGLDLYGSISPSMVVSYTVDFDSSAAMLLSLQCNQNACYDYVVQSNLDDKTLCMLTQSAISQSKILQPLCIHFKVFECPLGFVLNDTSKTCSCNQFLLGTNLSCNINNLTVLKSGRQWVGSISNILVAYDSCPYDYCIPSPISISLNAPDDQCNYYRGGILCGYCLEGLSAMFGSSRCSKCSNYYILHLATFALLGVALVATLLVLNITVSSGTINGLVFYANIIGINSSTFFSGVPWTITHFLSAYIAWVNLDFGVETCFYDGMDSYAKMWLYLAFPAYLFTMVGIFVLVGRKCVLISHVFRRNVIPVLATLLLLSFGKFVQTSIMLLSYAVLRVDTSGGGNSNDTIARARLLFDGNIEYFGYKHLPLFAIGLLIVLLMIPFLLLLLFSPCLLRWSHLRGCGWVNRLKPFIDSYHAPFNPRYRFWPGALLALRILLYTQQTINNTHGAPFNLLAIIVCCIAPLLFIAVFPVYRKWYCKLIEIFFYSNAILLSAAQLYLQGSDMGGISRDVLVLLMVGGAFLTTMGILLLHVFYRAKTLIAGKSMVVVSAEYKPLICAGKGASLTKDEDFQQLREPLVDD